MDGEEDGNVIEDLEVPTDIFPIVRLKEDVLALEYLLEGDIPKRIKSRLSKSG